LIRLEGDARIAAVKEGRRFETLRTLALSLALVHAAGSLSRAGAQVADENDVADEDPRSLVIFNLRLQHVELEDGNSLDLMLLRRDAAIRRPRSWRPGVRLATLRWDLPVGRAHLGGEEFTGLGDLYFQALNVRTPSRKFSLASGLGFQLPTATEDQLGSGKWQVAPTLFPIWTLPAVEGIFFIRAQNFVSVAGDEDRRDVNYLTLTPTLVHRLDARRALLFDTEVVTDWERDGELRWKSGLLFASRLGARRAWWVKLEVPWGEHRFGEWTVRTSVAWRDRKQGQGVPAAPQAPPAQPPAASGP
jgi:hypothetical protein